MVKELMVQQAVVVHAYPRAEVVAALLVRAGCTTAILMALLVNTAAAGLGLVLALAIAVPVEEGGVQSVLLVPAQVGYSHQLMLAHQHLALLLSLLLALSVLLPHPV